MGWIKVLGLGIASFVCLIYIIFYITLLTALAISVAFVAGTVIISWKIPRWIGVRSENNFLLFFIASNIIIYLSIILLLLKLVSMV